MPKTVNQRVTEWREKNVVNGGRSLSVWLDPQTAKMLDELSKHFRYPTYLKRGTKTSLVTRAIKKYHEGIFSVTVAK